MQINKFSFFLFSASWYLVKIYIYIFEFGDTSNVKSLMTQVKGSFSYKLLRGLNYAFGIFYPAVIILISFKNYYAIIGIFLVLPYFLIWSLFSEMITEIYQLLFL